MGIPIIFLDLVEKMIFVIAENIRLTIRQGTSGKRYGCPFGRGILYDFPSRASPAVLQAVVHFKEQGNIKETVRGITQDISRFGRCVQTFQLKIKIKKLAKILKWLAPIATLQTEEVLQKVRDEELKILNQLLEDMGF